MRGKWQRLIPGRRHTIPIHDWTRVPAGPWHGIHLGWLAWLQNALNNGFLPRCYHAQAVQIAEPFGPDILTLRANDFLSVLPNVNELRPDTSPSSDLVGIAVSVAPHPSHWGGGSEWGRDRFGARLRARLG